MGENPKLLLDPLSLLIFAIFHGLAGRYNGPAIIFVDEGEELLRQRLNLSEEEDSEDV